MSNDRTLGVILAGGQARRMGNADKAALCLGGMRLIDHVYGRLAPQTRDVVISGNHDYGLGLPAIPDVRGGVEGPVAGISAVWQWARENMPSTGGLLTVPVDAPFLPDDLAERLVGKTAAVAYGDDRLQPALGYWPMATIADHSAALKGPNWFSLKRLTTLCHARTVRFPDAGAFRNINSHEDLAEAEAWLSRYDG